jgi:AraC-like DNA-binding protein
MPQDRTLLQQAQGLRVERVVKHAAPAQWSPSYEAPTPRLVLPACGVTEFLLAGQTVLMDGITVLGLPRCVPYQMKPCVVQARTSIVVSTSQRGAPWQQQPGAWLLTPRALWRLRCHWRALALDGQGAEPTHTLLQTELRAATRMARSVGRSVEPVQRAQRFMAAQETAGRSLHDVADAACCSLFHLARQFRRHTGLSLHGYRQRLRLAVALQRLEDGERDLAGLAHELGYSSQSHFGNSFHREIGVTPSQARLQLTA